MRPTEAFIRNRRFEVVALRASLRELGSAAAFKSEPQGRKGHEEIRLWFSLHGVREGEFTARTLLHLEPHSVVCWIVTNHEVEIVGAGS